MRYEIKVILYLGMCEVLLLLQSFGERPEDTSGRSSSAPGCGSGVGPATFAVTVAVTYLT